MGKLTSIQIKNITPGSRPKKIFDGGGLYLLVKLNGMYWRYKYRYYGKEKTLAIGTYPMVSLKKARQIHQDACRLLQNDIDPGYLRKIKKDTKIKSSENCFAEMAWEWFAKQPWSDGHRIKQRGRLENDIIPYIGNQPANEITAKDVLSICRRVEDRGVIEGAHRIKTICSQIFRYGIAKGEVDSDPCRDLRNALTPYVGKHMAAITNPSEVGGLLRAIDDYQGNNITRAALKLAPLVFVRPGELRHAEWSEIEFDTQLWKIPGEKMKMKRIHIVPLAIQSLKILLEIRHFTGTGKYVFPSVRTTSRPMSENTINAALRRMGYTKEEITGHGFRSTASTLLHESGWDSTIIEMQMAHKDADAIRGAYNHAKYLKQRIEMMQTWADYLDELKNKKYSLPG